MKNEQLKKRMSTIVGVVIFAVIVIAFLAANGNNSKHEPDIYMDSLRKCTVMEGADIWKSGVGGKGNNVFDDARDTCQDWYKTWSEEDFYSSVSEDWEKRKDEEVDGKSLTHYLDILGW